MCKLIHIPSERLWFYKTKWLNLYFDSCEIFLLKCCQCSSSLFNVFLPVLCLCRLRSDHNVWGDVPVLLSLEKPLCKLISPVDLDPGGSVNPLDYQV